MSFELNTKDSQIIQQNQMLMGGQTINLRARQLVYVLAAMMDRERPTDMIRVSATEFLNFVNANNKEKWTDIYSLTSEIFDHLNDNPILLRKPKSKDFTKINWLSRLGVVKGHLEARFSPDIADYFLYRQGLPYTKLLWDIRAYQSRFTARILDLFQRHHIKESRNSEVVFEYSVDDLKLFFGVHDQYPRFYDFEKRILKVTCAELEAIDTAPYWFEYEKVKSGRNVSKIRFYVHVRPKVLIEMVPELNRIQSGDSSQFSLFNSGEWELTNEGKQLLAAYRKLRLTEAFALKILGNLTNTQSRAYYNLVKYGVNRSLAFTLVNDHCSFGELIGYEDHYVKFALDQTEKKRIRRIAEAKSGKSKKKTTPDDKRGGLAKKVFVDQLYFSEFMERLSSIRNEYGTNHPKPLIKPLSNTLN
jgi:plasmid replication initiation protein